MRYNVPQFDLGLGPSIIKDTADQTVVWATVVPRYLLHMRWNVSMWRNIILFGSLIQVCCSACTDKAEHILRRSHLMKLMSEHQGAGHDQQFTWWNSRAWSAHSFIAAILRLVKCEWPIECTNWLFALYFFSSLPFSVGTGSAC